ncbi:MAG: phospholipase D-like domain-containing protein [Spirochaetota bacterium]|nr:phospholipase D-like domain-containing protein [Spirochaetota bacterium]
MKKKNCTKFIFSLLCAGLSLLCVSCTLFDMGERAQGSWGETWPKSFQVYFTEPGISMGTGVDRKMAERIGDFIRSAKKSVDINIYELSAPAIYTAVVDMHKKGLRVRMVGDGDNGDYEGYKALAAAGVPMCIANYINNYGETSIMHNKFVVVDEERITMGSMNYTDVSALRNNENVVFIQNEKIAKYYTQEMNNMFIYAARGLDKKPFEGFANNIFTLDEGEPSETKMEVWFSPYATGGGRSFENTKLRMIDAINKAKSTIHFAIFSYTDRDTATAMEAAHKRGVHVYGVFDAGWHESNAYALHQRLTDAGLDVRMDGNDNYDPKNPYHGCKIHNKLLVIDADSDHPDADPMVLTGSLNFSPSAATDGNDENSIFIHNRVIAQRYSEEIMKMYNHGWHLTRSTGGEGANLLDVVIDEINWAGSKADNGSTNADDKFVALRNRSGRDINISGWLLWGAKSSSYRIMGHVIPARTLLRDGCYYIVGYTPQTSAFTWDSTWGSFGYIKGMPTAVTSGRPVLDPMPSTLPNVCYLRLRDVNQKTIDEAGRMATGLGSNSTYYASQKRIGPDGLSAAGWVTVGESSDAVRDGYTTYTRAFPGRAYNNSDQWEP